MTNLLGDFRFAARTLARTPGWTAAAVLTLTLGVAANTTVFSWLRPVVLAPIPLAKEPDSLKVVFARTASGEVARVSYPDYRDLARRTDVLASLLAQQWLEVGLGTPGQGSPQMLSCALVSSNYFETMGVRPEIGRGFRSDEESGRGAPPVAVISHALWTRAFGSDPAVAGRVALLNSQPFTIVGVAPPGFYGSFLGIGTDIWVPLVQVGRFQPAVDRLDARGDRWLLMIGRLKRGVSTQSAQAALAAESARLNHDYPGIHDGYTIDAAALWQSPWGSPAELGPILLTLAALVSLVLLIACANVANLFLNRAIGRRREIAVRLALGASRAQITRQLLIEGVVLSLAAAAAATIVTFWTSGMLRAFIPPTGMPVQMDLTVDGGVVLFALGVSLAATLVFSLAPSLSASRAAVAEGLAAGAVTVVGVRGRARLRGALVVAQIALSLVLLVAAGLFLRSLNARQSRSPGFDPRRILLVDLKLEPAGYGPLRGALLLEQLTERVPEIAGVQDAALALRPPLGFGRFQSTGIAVEGYAPRAGDDMRARFNAVSPGYFRTMRIPVRRGREFAGADRPRAEPVAIVNETFAQRYLGGREILGGRIRVDGVWRRVVGVAADAKYEKLDEAPLPFLFLPLAQTYHSEVSLHVRTSGEPAATLPAVREAIARLDSNLPLFEVQTMEQHLGEELFSQRIASALLGALGLLAVVISAVGLYALAAFAVAERRREIGVRMALGASPQRLVRTFLAEGMRLAGVGVGIGVAAALALGRAIASQLPGISSSDPVAFLGVTLLVAVIAAAASFIPARRAARVGPMETLRIE